MKVTFLWAGLSFTRSLSANHLFGGKKILKCWKCVGGREDLRNLCWSVIYSIVQKRHKETPEQVNGDYYKTN